MGKQNEEIDFRNRSEKQLQAVLRFSQSVRDRNAELEKAVESARTYAEARNDKRTGCVTRNSHVGLEVRGRDESLVTHNLAGQLRRFRLAGTVKE